MKISQTLINGPITRPSDASRGSGSSKSSTTTAPANSSAVELSSTARHLATLNAEPEVNLVKVNEIRQALKDGTLQINPERIADGLLASAQELIAGK